jgi:hypothetical protein
MVFISVEIRTLTSEVTLTHFKGWSLKVGQPMANEKVLFALQN